MPLTLPQLTTISQNDDPFISEALSDVVEAINNISLKTGVDSTPSAQSSTPGETPENFPAPEPPASISVQAITVGTAKIYAVGIAMSPSDDGLSIQYYVEFSATANFDISTPLRLGLQNFVPALLIESVANNYWRARCKLPESGYSSYVYFGTQANPTGV